MPIIKKILIVLLIIIASFILLVIYNVKEKNWLNKIEFEAGNLKDFKDGKYIGEYKKYGWTYKVEAKVENHQVKSVQFIDTKKIDDYSEEIPKLKNLDTLWEDIKLYEERN